MRNINKLYLLGLGMLLGTLLAPAVSFAQQPFPWQLSLENAQRVAAQSNRLVLIHFSAPWCGPCNRMESEVFNQPGVADALSAHYVPVKINADQMPDTAKKFGVTALPTDVVITPQGQVVETMRGRSEATQYVIRLNQIASMRQQNASQIAQVPASIPARPIDRATMDQPAANAQPAGKYALSDDRYADYNRKDASDQRYQPAATSTASSREPIQANPASISPQYGQQQPAATPELTGPNFGQAPIASSQQVQNIAPPAAQNQQQPVMTNPQQQALANLSPQVGTTPQQQAVVNPSQQISPPANQISQQPAGNQSQPQVAQGATPTLCMDGFSPVSLTEKSQWIQGDRRFGAIHRGRIYLFTDKEEQKRFFADPDRYAPVISGNDIMLAMEKGVTTSGKREHGVFFNGHIYLFADEAGLEKFSTNPTYFASQALGATQASVQPSPQMR